MPRVTLPEGAKAVDTAGRYTARAGDPVTVSAANVEQVRRFTTRRGERFTVGTRGGRVCGPCRRRWNVWSAVCPRCGTATTPEEAAG